MKKVKEYLVAILIIAAVGSLLFFIYQRGSSRTNRELARRIAELSPRGGPPETIEGLRQAIAIYEDQIERNVREGAQTGVYWKILSTRLADRNLHNEALDALERAIFYNPEDPILYYLTGVSAAVVAKSKVGFTAGAEREREQFYRLSENAYIRAMELDITYTRAMYGLAVLYVFELDRPEEAIPYLDRYLQIQTTDFSAMFILARAYYMLENFSQAIEIYDRIISRARDQSMRDEALNNKNFIQRFMYE